ncbi:hypothetical protein QDW19_gp45 [Microbacterium phage AvGardian]|uniref:hypothetical protein n=1 Tax=Microbacterium phage AvGardian TaxID=2725619 RepID=UPI001462A174|nr:hypothetical protein QDW19_gp45 [Microbacterium phage AvGardian]QJD49860.1 hypothetical protein SEA_AVGARDIAN_45 [Microbacterium phage AvGardian]
MAAIIHYTHFRRTERPDGLCPHCLNPALKEFTAQRIDMDGVTPVGTRVACVDCRVWLGPIKEFAK